MSFSFELVKFALQLMLHLGSLLPPFPVIRQREDLLVGLDPKTSHLLVQLRDVLVRQAMLLLCLGQDALRLLPPLHELSVLALREPVLLLLCRLGDPALGLGQRRWLHVEVQRHDIVLQRLDASDARVAALDLSCVDLVGQRLQLRFRGADAGHHLGRLEHLRMQSVRLEELAVGDLEVGVRPRLGNFHDAVLGGSLDAHGGHLALPRGHEPDQLADLSAGLDVGARQPRLVEAVDEGKEVVGGDAQGSQVRGVGASKRPVETAVDGFGGFFRPINMLQGRVVERLHVRGITHGLKDGSADPRRGGNAGRDSSVVAAVIALVIVGDGFDHNGVSDTTAEYGGGASVGT